MASSRDDQVLELIFDPNRQELGFSEVSESVPEPSKCDEQLDEVEKDAKRHEVEGIGLAEKGDLTSALACFDIAVKTAPKYASAYNNRAQALRMKGDVSAAMDDLNMAIELSKARGKVAEMALVQRAMLKRLQEDNEGAWQDFREAAALGSSFAKAEAIKLNPYAAMCNQMLSEVMSKLQSGES